MNPESNWQAFRGQQRLFSNLVVEEVHQSGTPSGIKRPSPKEVLAFVEGLLLCPTVEAARVHIARDRESAEMCRIVVNDVVRAVDAKSAVASIERAINETPFFLIASMLYKRARLTVEEYGDSWS